MERVKSGSAAATNGEKRFQTCRPTRNPNQQILAACCVNFFCAGFIPAGDFCIGDHDGEGKKWICCSNNRDPAKPYKGFGCCAVHPVQTRGKMICVGQGSDVCSKDGCLVGESWLCGPGKDGKPGGCCNDPDLYEADGQASTIQ